MRRRYDHVGERALSGAGLVNLYNALRELAAALAASFAPAQITDPQYWTEDPHARSQANVCAMLGMVAGNLALTIGARGGIYIAGGIVPRLGAIFAESSFSGSLQAKGRFRSYLTAIPTYVITRPLPALLGRPAAGARLMPHLASLRAFAPLVAFAREHLAVGEMRGRAEDA